MRRLFAAAAMLAAASMYAYAVTPQNHGYTAVQQSPEQTQANTPAANSTTAADMQAARRIQLQQQMDRLQVLKRALPH